MMEHATVTKQNEQTIVKYLLNLVKNTNYIVVRYLMCIVPQHKNAFARVWMVIGLNRSINGRNTSH